MTAPFLRGAVSHGGRRILRSDAHGSLLLRLLDAASESTVMVDSDIKFLLVPMGLAVAFMLWVIWALEKQIRRDKREFDANARAKTVSDRPSNTGPDGRTSGPGGF